MSREPGAVHAVLRDNLFGLELDPRCTQLAAFNLALCAWRADGYRTLPRLNLACSGLAISAREEDWAALAGTDRHARATMEKLHALFRQAPILGSLIDPLRVTDPLFATEIASIRPLLERALKDEAGDDAGLELAVAAQGVTATADLLARRYHLIITNVPYLTRGKHCAALRDFCERHYADAKNDLANVFLERCLELARPGHDGVVQVVMPQNWLFLTSYKEQRQRLVRDTQWALLAMLGPGAFETISGEVVKAILLTLGSRPTLARYVVHGFDVSELRTVQEKAEFLLRGEISAIPQYEWLGNPDFIVSMKSLPKGVLLGSLATCHQGASTGDSSRYIRAHWEVDHAGYEFLQGPPRSTLPFAGREAVINWNETVKADSSAIRGSGAWNLAGVAIGQMSDLPATLFSGTRFVDSAPVIVPVAAEMLPALWCFSSSPAFRESLRAINRKLSVNNGYVGKIAFNLANWNAVAVERYPNGLPAPHSDDPTQWLFHGHPFGSVMWDEVTKRTVHGAPSLTLDTLQVAVARLGGYRWPAEQDASMELAPEQREWVRRCAALDEHADRDGIVCLAPLRGEPRAAERLQSILADAWDGPWTAAQQNALLEAAGFAGRTLDAWLRDGFFEQHCQRFHQRPFIWHVWDGRDDGFGALVNYHRLAALDGGGRRTLEKLIYAYLGDWIDRQRADQKAGVEGSDARLAAAEHLCGELQRILEGEPPYDLFVRWKPLRGQPIGWEPDLDDGVRINIRPFVTARPLKARGRNASILRVTPNVKWDKDRGKEVERERQNFPWFWGWDGSTTDFGGGPEFDGNRWNDLHYSRAFKEAARQRVRAGARGGAR